MLNNEIIRENMLKYLYEISQSARSMKSASVGILKLRSEMKNRYGHKQNEVVANLAYLLDREWVKKEIEEKEYTLPQGTVVHPRSEKYRITAIGVDYIEGPSKFQNENKFTNINVKKIKGFVIIGNNNIVNSQLQELYGLLEILERKVAESKYISDEQKLIIESDIGTIKSQMAKPQPNFGVVKQIWNGIEKTVTASGLIEIINKISGYISNLNG